MAFLFYTLVLFVILRHYIYFVFWQKQMQYKKQLTECTCNKRCRDKEKLLLILFNYKKLLFYLHINECKGTFTFSNNSQAMTKRELFFLYF